MPRGDSVSRIMDTRKGTCEVRVLKNCYAPTAYRCIVKFISGRDTTKKPVNKRIDSHTATYLLQNQEALTDKMICRCPFC